MCHHTNQNIRIMKLRLYHDTRKEFRNCVDAWTIYVPYPKWLQKETHGAKGTYLGCAPTETGMIRCCWAELMYYEPCSFGKKIDPKTQPKAFQKIFYNLERAWNNAINKNTDAAWNAWYRA